MKSEIKIKVRGYHEDHFMHVNHTRYLEFLEEARWKYFEDNNLIENLFHRKSVFLAVVNVTIDYMGSAVTGDMLHIKTDVVYAGKQKVILSQKIFNKKSNKLIINADITNVFLDNNSKQPIAINNEMIQTWPELNVLAKKDS